MAVIVYFPPSDTTTEQYDKIVKELEAVGAHPAPGLLSHACFQDDGKLSVCDLWEDEASFRKFGETLMPIAQKVGAKFGDPYVTETHAYFVAEPART